MTKRECNWDPTKLQGKGDWDCNRKFVPLSRWVEKIREASADANTPVYFYSNLRPPTAAENPNTWNPWRVHEVWANAWLEWRGIKKHYSVFNAVDLRWLLQQLWETGYHGDEMDQSGLDEKEVWPLTKEGALDTKEITTWCYMQALGAAAIFPDAYIFTTKDTKWRSDSTFERVEYWKLAENMNIQRIWRVDPTPGGCNYEPELMLFRGADGKLQGQPGMLPLNDRWRCPVKEPAAQQPQAAPPADPQPAPAADPQPETTTTTAPQE